MGKMLQAGLPVPAGFAVAVDAFDGQGKLGKEAAEQLKSNLDANKKYAVRSSATVEDAEGASWAGQFDSYLNVPANEVLKKVEDCHNSTKVRAHSYAEEAGSERNFHVAVVVQEMVEAKVAGVLFTKDPSSGVNKIITEYVYGLGEALVHGDADPERVVWSRGRRTVKEQTQQELPFPLSELIKLAEKIEHTFDGVPQDIEWAYDGEQIWLVQSRPITTLQDRGRGKHYLGDPGKLFYWGPSRAQPLYMSDFTDAAWQFFQGLANDPAMPTPPKILVLFHDGQVVWLIKAAEFGKFVSDLFRVYERAHRLQEDINDWQKAAEAIDNYFASAKDIDLGRVSTLFMAAWTATLAAEFSLYGAETVLLDRLSHFDEKARHEIWGTMTLPDKPTFMQQLDVELAQSADPDSLTDAYPWIEDGYSGVSTNTADYFRKRLKVVKGNTVLQAGSPDKRQDVIKKYALKPSEIKALDLARELSVFMDDRKAWMMRTRRYIAQVAEAAAIKLDIAHEQAKRGTLERFAAGNSEPFYGGSFMNGEVIMLNSEDVNLAWDWYVEFRAARSVLKGLVASSGGRHFINGVVFVAHTPQDAMPDDAVLVVPSTSPSYVPLMRKARALITDHGGMMSHAAIVAREFGLPAIVGTKQATKVLKDGDKVVLDLVKGEINR